jgi:hypothetical protein
VQLPARFLGLLNRDYKRWKGMGVRLKEKHFQPFYKKLKGTGVKLKNKFFNYEFKQYSTCKQVEYTEKRLL